MVMVTTHLGSLTDFAGLLKCRDAACACAGAWRPLASARGVDRLGAWTLHAEHHRLLATQTRDTSLKLRAIGFDLGDNATRDWQSNVEQLSRIAKSLLLHQQVLKSKPAQSFLYVLVNLRRGMTEDALSHYGEWYRELMALGCSSWQDHLLDEIILGRNNPLAKAAALGNLAEEQGPLHAAAAHDLDVLQKLAVAETTLAGWVSEAVNPGPAGWLQAASSMGSPSQRGAPETPSSAGVAPPQALNGSSGGGSSSSIIGDFIGAPLTPQERQEWRGRVGGSWRWSEALPDLVQLWRERGTGLVAGHSLLQWSGSALVGLTPAQQGDIRIDKSKVWHVLMYCEVGCKSWEAYRAFADDNMAVHGFSRHSLLFEQSQRRHASMAMWSGLQQEHCPRGVRLVRLLPSDVGSIDELGRALGQHPRVRFVVVSYPFQLTAATAAAVLPALAGGGNWPCNAALCAITEKSYYSPMREMSEEEAYAIESLKACFGCQMFENTFDKKCILIDGEEVP